MRKLSFLAVTLAALLAPSIGSAQLTLGARLGYGMAGGEAEKDAKMSDGLSGLIPVQLEAGYKLTKELQVGAYFSYGFGRLGGDIKDVCDAENLDCSAYNWRLGVQGSFAFEDLNPQFVPWIGAGIGYEKAGYKMEGGGESLELNYGGFELINLQVGGDFKAAPNLKAGVFLSYSFGRYGSWDGKLSAGGASISDDGDVEDKTLHNYLVFGLRGEFSL